MYCNVCGKNDRYHGPKLWSIFKKLPNGRFERASEIALTKCAAITFFQSALIFGGVTLRPLKESKTA